MVYCWKDIHSGAILPKHLFDLLRPPATIVDFGGGQGNKAKVLSGMGYNVAVADINPEAIVHSQRMGVLAIEADITDIRVVDRIRELFFGNVDAVVMEALLCNLVDDDWQIAIQHADEVLKEGGCLFIADVLCADHPNPLLEEGDNFSTWRKEWKERYGNNTRLGLPWGTFVVAKPGVNKSIEYGPPESLQELMKSENFERYARHLDESELIEYCSEIGFETIIFEYLIWQSRENKPLSGFILICQKQ